MTLVKKSKITTPTVLKGFELDRIKDYLQGAVYYWINNRGDGFFSLGDLVGGENADWTGTPPGLLYQAHHKRVSNDVRACEQADKELGWVLQAVLDEDRRLFDSDDNGMVVGYRWVGS